jgi:phosphoribosylanthranilate isomerase
MQGTLRPQIKICGLKTKEQVILCKELGFAFVGFVFYKKSCRNISFKELQALNLQSEEFKDIKKVGVFVNPSLADVSLAVKYGIDILQLHGKESFRFVCKIKSKHPDIKIIKAFGLDAQTKTTILNIKLAFFCLAGADYFLFDTKTRQHGGSGQSFDWSLLKKIKTNKKYFLSGGIDKINIKPALLYSNFIDLSSGVEESRGQKSEAKIKEIASIALNTNGR